MNKIEIVFITVVSIMVITIFILAYQIEGVNVDALYIFFLPLVVLRVIRAILLMRSSDKQVAFNCIFLTFKQFVMYRKISMYSFGASAILVWIVTFVEMFSTNYNPKAFLFGAYLGMILSLVFLLHDKEFAKKHGIVMLFLMFMLTIVQIIIF